MKFSIIIPAYNAEKTITKSVNSLLKSHYKSFEIVIINDGSKDKTEEIINRLSLKHSNIKIFSQKNSGPFIARNKGVELATGEYILFMDADDFFVEDALEKLREVCDGYNDIILFKYNIIKDNRLVINNKMDNFNSNMEIEKEEVFNIMIKSNDLNSLCTKAIKRELILTKKFNKSLYFGLKNGEDLIYSLFNLINANKILFINEKLYNYVHNSESTTNQFNLSFFESRIILRSSFLETVNFLGFPENNYYKKINRRFLLDIVKNSPNTTQILNVGYKKILNYYQIISADRTFKDIYTLDDINIKFKIKLFLLKKRYIHSLMFLFLLEDFFRITKKLITDRDI